MVDWNQLTLIWLNQHSALSSESTVCLRSWYRNSNQWKIQVLFDRDIANYPVTRANALKCKHDAQIADLMRLESIYQKGGFYLDTDILALPLAAQLPQIINSIIEKHKLDRKHLLICCNEDNTNYAKYISNSFFGSTPGNPLLSLILNEAKDSLVRLSHLSINNVTGPWCWSRALQKGVLGGFGKQPNWQTLDQHTSIRYWLIPTSQVYDGYILMLDSSAWYPWLWNQSSSQLLQRALAGEATGLGVHLWGHSWKSTPAPVEKSNPRLIYITQIASYNPTRVKVWHNVMRRNILENQIQSLFDIYAFTYRKDDPTTQAILADLEQWLPKERWLAVPYEEELFNRGLGHNLIVESLNQHFTLQPKDQLVFVDGDIWFLQKDAVEIAHHLRTVPDSVVSTKVAIEVIDQHSMDERPSEWAVRTGMCFSGGAAAYTFATHQAIQGWPENYPIYGFEDAEMDLRLASQCTNIAEQLVALPLRARHAMSVVEKSYGEFFEKNKQWFDFHFLSDYCLFRSKISPMLKQIQLDLNQIEPFCVEFDLEK